MKNLEISPNGVVFQQPSQPEQFDPHHKDAWASAIAKKINWFRAAQGGLAAVCEARGVNFDPELFILGEIFNSIIGDDENALQVLAMHYDEQGNAGIVRQYAAQSKKQILLRLAGHLAQAEIPQGLRAELHRAVGVIEKSNFLVKTEFMTAQAAFHALKDWVNAQQSFKDAMEYDYMLSTVVVSQLWYESFV